MEHFYETIPGWASQPLVDLYKKMVAQTTSGVFVEVGTWLGRSACLMAVEIINANKNIEFHCVDHWRGSAEHAWDDNVINGTLYWNFLINIKPVEHKINPIKLPSLEAAKLFQDNSIDFVFLDASHDYENVKADITAWYPKVKVGGILAGHDYPDTKGWFGVKEAVDEFVLNNPGHKVDTSTDSWTFVK